MRTDKQIIPILAFAVAVILSALTSNAEAALQTVGYQIKNCNQAQNLDGGHNCTTSGTVDCSIGGFIAYNTQANCQAGGTTGILKRTP